MNMFYDQDIDYAEVMFISTPNFGVETSDFVMEFLSEKTGEVVGYGFYRATESVEKFPNLSEKLKRELRDLLKGGKNDQTN